MSEEVVLQLPDEWRSSVAVPIYKNKEDRQNYTNYRGLKLMRYYEAMGDSNGAKTQKTKISEYQFEFMLGRSTIEVIFYIGN